MLKRTAKEVGEIHSGFKEASGGSLISFVTPVHHHACFAIAVVSLGRTLPYPIVYLLSFILHNPV